MAGFEWRLERETAIADAGLGCDIGELVWLKNNGNADTMSAENING